MAQSSIPAPSKMEMKGDLVNNWQYFKRSWENYEVATELTKKSDAIRVATLLSVMGRECYQVYENLPLTADERKKTDTILEKLGNHFEPQRNTIYERYMYNSAMQEAHENIEQFYNRLRKLSSTCNFGTLLDEMLRDRLVIGIKDNPTRARLLREPNLKLDKALDICRSSEVAALQLHAMETPDETVHHLQSKAQASHKKKPKPCIYCGDIHKYGKCPAYGLECPKCHKKNHFAKVCRSTQSSSTSTEDQKRKHKKGNRKSIKLQKAQMTSAAVRAYIPYTPPEPST